MGDARGRVARVVVHGERAQRALQAVRHLLECLREAVPDHLQLPQHLVQGRGRHRFASTGEVVQGADRLVGNLRPSRHQVAAVIVTDDSSSAVDAPFDRGFRHF